jgi:hypothetical protein
MTQLWWDSRLKNVSLYAYDYEESKELGMDSLDELVQFVRICERCNCEDIRHHNGGSYHKVIRIFQITEDVYAVSHENTREIFCASELRNVVIFIDKDTSRFPIGKITLKEGEYVRLITREEAEEIINNYERDPEYRVYWEE